MMFTSYYFSSKIIGLNTKLIRISASCPRDLNSIANSKVYKPLCPDWDLVSQYKRQEINDQQYTILYYKNTLDCLDPEKVYKDLGEDSVLLCWENPTKFCHRHIVANWLRKSIGVEVREL